ncbi:MAG TPA: hypothetical protein VMW26_06965 [Methanomassiliicoccales archaeon]|nr:hypothetical protein [Methanomassiliicoccales archaeon]
MTPVSQSRVRSCDAKLHSLTYSIEGVVERFWGELPSVTAHAGKAEVSFPNGRSSSGWKCTVCG